MEQDLGIRMLVLDNNWGCVVEGLETIMEAVGGLENHLAGCPIYL